MAYEASKTATQNALEHAIATGETVVIVDTDGMEPAHAEPNSLRGALESLKEYETLKAEGLAVLADLIRSADITGDSFAVAGDGSLVGTSSMARQALTASVSEWNGVTRLYVGLAVATAIQGDCDAPPSGTVLRVACQGWARKSADPHGKVAWFDGDTIQETRQAMTDLY